MAPNCCFISKVEANLKKHSSKKHSSYSCAFLFGHCWSLRLQSNISWWPKVEPKSVWGSTHEIASVSTAAQRNVFRLKLPSVPTVYPTLHHLTSSFSSSHHQQNSLFCSILNPQKTHSCCLPPAHNSFAYPVRWSASLAHGFLKMIKKEEEEKKDTYTFKDK